MSAPVQPTCERWHLSLARNVAWKASRYFGVDWDDAHSDALYGLAKALNKGIADERVAGFMRNAVKHGYRNRMRAIGRNGGLRLDAPVGVTIDRHEGTLYDTTPDVAPTIHERAEWDELWEAVGRLPLEEKRAIELYYGCGLAQSEIAKAYGTNQMRVSRWLSQGREHLKTLLEEHGQ